MYKSGDPTGFFIVRQNQALLLEICRRLKGESVELVEAHVLPSDQPAQDLFNSAKFEMTGRLLTFRRWL